MIIINILTLNIETPLLLTIIVLKFEQVHGTALWCV